jgi:plastocyanin
MRQTRRCVVTLAALLLCAAFAGQDTGTVAGTIAARGVRTAADIVVSLQAPGLVATPPAEPVEMDQRGMLFLPRVLPVVVGTTVRFLNNDPVPHNVFSPEGKYNLGTWPTGEVRDFTFEDPGAYTQLCRVHLEMEAFVVVLETPYFGVTDRRGNFEIPDVPAGEYTLVTWHNRLQPAEQPVSVTAGTTASVELTLRR